MEYSLGLYEKALPTELPFAQKFALAGRCGFDRFEISVDESDERLARLDWSSAEQSELGRLAREAMTPIRTLCLSAQRKYPFGSHDPALRERSCEILRKAVLFCVNAGISVIQLAGYDVYYEQGDEESEKWFRQNLAEATDFAARWGVVLAFETMETPFMDTVEKAMRYVKALSSPYLGVYPDIGNLKNASVLYRTDTVSDLRNGSGHIFAAHLKETKPGIYRDLFFGEGGHTEYLPCLRELWRQGVRLYTGEFWYHGEENYRERLIKASTFLREKIETAAALP